MVITEIAPNHLEGSILVQPNQSMNWRETKWFLLATAVILGGIAAAFAYQGFWMILPFAGIELAALAYCSLRVIKASRRCQLITFTQDEVIVEKGQRRCGTGGGPESRFAIPRCWARIELEKRIGWYPLAVNITASGKRVEVGEFLAEEEKQDLAKQIRGLLA